LIFELKLIAQNFFKEGFGIPRKKIRLYLRPTEMPYQQYEQHYSINETVEKFINTSKSTINDVMKKREVLIYDEINFSHFYEQTREHEQLLTFLTTMKADLFLPILW